MFISGFPLFSCSFCTRGLPYSLSCPPHSYSCLSDPSSLIFLSQLVFVFFSFGTSICKAWKSLPLGPFWLYLSGQKLLASLVSGCNWITMTLLTVFPSWPHNVPPINLNELQTDKQSFPDLVSVVYWNSDSSFASTMSLTLTTLSTLKNLLGL